MRDLFALVFMDLSVHRCLSECHCVSCYCGHMCMDVYVCVRVCVVLEISLCAACLSLEAASLCVQECVTCKVVCLPLVCLHVCAARVCAVCRCPHVVCMSLSLCVYVSGAFLGVFCSLVCVCAVWLPSSRLSRFQGAE